MAGARIPLNLAVVTVSDTRTMETDTSGALLAEKLRAEGHQLHSRNIVKDDVYQLRALLSKLIADPEVRGVLTTGGTGFTARDNTRKAVMPLFDVEIEGFGELFRQISFTEIGTSTVQSRAFGGIANGTVIFCLPGSTGACRTGWDHILREQLDSTHKPCNFAERIIKT
ncbi:MAG: molybdenum cofactor biosynthesis protein B [Gammaproteobacteria bacterium]|nr:molybdenum cofactor biosynthesis protein B [Gammaproteobacteria bacterium]MCY4296786.1 molybdenum cofactor biosynthesis protein B [Gammaproteobacteria bacterium]